MGDVLNLEHLAATSSGYLSNSIHSTSSKNSTIHSFNSPLLHSTHVREEQVPRQQSLPLPHSFQNAKREGYIPGRLQKSHNLSVLTSVDSHPINNPSNTAFQQPTSSPRHLPLRSKTFAGRTPTSSQGDLKNQYQLLLVNESLAAFRSELDFCSPNPTDVASTLNKDRESITTTSPFSSPPPTPRHSSFISTGSDSHSRRKSLDLKPMRGSIRRLTRSPSLWTTSLHHASDRPSSPGAELQRRFHEIQNFRAEARLTEREKLLSVKRARKLAQVTRFFLLVNKSKISSGLWQRSSP